MPRISAMKVTDRSGVGRGVQDCSEAGLASKYGISRLRAKPTGKDGRDRVSHRGGAGVGIDVAADTYAYPAAFNSLSATIPRGRTTAVTRS